MGLDVFDPVGTDPALQPGRVSRRWERPLVCDARQDFSVVSSFGVKPFTRDSPRTTPPWS